MVLAQTTVEAPKYGESSRTAAISAPSDPVPTVKTSSGSGGIERDVRGSRILRLHGRGRVLEAGEPEFYEKYKAEKNATSIDGLSAVQSS
jgi:hypothetical protein